MVCHNAQHIILLATVSSFSLQAMSLKEIGNIQASKKQQEITVPSPSFEDLLQQLDKTVLYTQPETTYSTQQPLQSILKKKIDKIQKTPKGHQKPKPIRVEDGWTCPFCPKKYDVIHAVYHHMKDSCKKRPIITTYSCPYTPCDYTATSNNTLYIHKTKYCKFRPEFLPCVYAALGCSELFKKIKERRIHTAICPFQNKKQ